MRTTLRAPIRAPLKIEARGDEDVVVDGAAGEMRVRTHEHVAAERQRICRGASEHRLLHHDAA